jgi:prevent-host-death family protein
MVNMTTASATLNVADAKRQFSDLLGRVAYRGEEVVITRRGKPMAKLVPLREPRAKHLADVQGWLSEDDPFFEAIDEIVASRSSHLPRPVQLDD